MIIANFGAMSKCRTKSGATVPPDPSGNTMRAQAHLWFMMCVHRTLWPVDKLLINQDRLHQNI